MSKYFAKVSGEKMGPFTEAQLRILWKDGKLSGEDELALDEEPDEFVQMLRDTRPGLGGPIWKPIVAYLDMLEPKLKPYVQPPPTGSMLSMDMHKSGEKTKTLNPKDLKDLERARSSNPGTKSGIVKWAILLSVVALVYYFIRVPNTGVADQVKDFKATRVQDGTECSCVVVDHEGIPIATDGDTTIEIWARKNNQDAWKVYYIERAFSVVDFEQTEVAVGENIEKVLVLPIGVIKDNDFSPSESEYTFKLTFTANGHTFVRRALVTMTKAN